MSELRTACSHVRQLRGIGKDSGTTIEAWFCYECGDYLLDQPSSPIVVTFTPYTRAAGSEPDTRPCPACGDLLGPDETHWSIMPAPMGGYLCPRFVDEDRRAEV